MVTPVAKRGVSYSWEMVTVEVSEEIIRMGFIQTEGLILCTTAVNFSQLLLKSLAEQFPGLLWSWFWKLLPKSEFYRVIAWAKVTKKC